MAASKKQYGLILSKSKANKSQLLSKPSVFDDGSDDDESEDSRRRQVNSALRREGIKKLEAKTTRNMLTEALSEDPTVFDYDGIYDEMQAKKIASDLKLKAKKDTKSKYIANLKRTAEIRKVEQELAYERKVQKEREAEGEVFSDKDAFVTPSYIKKLQERAEIEAKLKKEEEIEKLNDVTKQTDLSRFYRNVLDRKTSGETTAVPSDETEIKREETTRKLSPQIDDEPEVADDIEHDSVKDESQDLVETEGTDGDINSQTEEQLPEETSNVVDDVSEIQSEVQPDEEIRETAEERRRRIFAKRTNDETAMSAKERYLARKRAKLSQPVIASDD